MQKRFLRECGFSDEEALLHFNLVPLETRRDIAKLGLIHRSVLGGGPRHFANSFCPLHRRVHQKHDKQFITHRSPRHLESLSRSALDSLISTICHTIMWFGRRVWLPCSTNFWLIKKFRVRNVTVIGFTPSLHVFLCMGTRCYCSHDFFFCGNFSRLGDSEVLRQHAGDV